jgi:hypothetical protein
VGRWTADKYTVRVSLLIAIALLQCACLSEPSPDTTFLYGGWTDDQGDRVRLRGIKSKLSNVPGVIYIEGRVELFQRSNRRVGVWNFGQSRPFIVLNMVPYDGNPEYWAIIANSADRATAWVSSDPNVFVRKNWQQGLTRREMRKRDSDWNPEPKLSSAEARLAPGAEVVN